MSKSREWLFELTNLQRVELRETNNVDGDWRMMFAFGEVLHPTMNFTVDEEFVEEMVAAFEYLRDEYGYFPPICVEHKFDVDFERLGEMKRLPRGVVEKIERWSEEDDEVIAAVVDNIGEVSEGLVWGFINALQIRKDGLWARPVYKKAADTLRKLDLLDYVSPSFFPEAVDPHTGRTLRYLLRELTHCTIPHQKNLRTPLNQSAAVGLSELGFKQTTEEGEKMEEEEVQAMIDAALEPIIAAIGEVQEMLAGEVEVEGGEEVDNEEDEKMTAMSDRLEYLEKMSVAVPRMMERFNVGAEDARKYAKLELADKEAFAVLAKRLVSTGPDETQIEGFNGSPVPVKNSESGEGAVDLSTDKAKLELVHKIAVEMREDGVPRRSVREELIARSNNRLDWSTLPHRTSEVIDHVFNS